MDDLSSSVRQAFVYMKSLSKSNLETLWPTKVYQTFWRELAILLWLTWLRVFSSMCRRIDAQRKIGQVSSKNQFTIHLCGLPSKFIDPVRRLHSICNGSLSDLACQYFSACCINQNSGFFDDISSILSRHKWVNFIAIQLELKISSNLVAL